MSKNVDALKSGYAAFAKGDIPTVLSLFDPKIEWTEAEGFPYAGTFVGHDAVVQNVFQKLGTEWDGFKVEAKEFIDGGDRIVALGKYSGTCKATGKSFEADFAHVWTFRGGIALKFYQYADTALVQAAFQG